MEHASSENSNPEVILTPTEVQRMIAEGISAAREADRLNNTNGANHETNTVTPRNCTYKDFMTCKPTNFKGIEGVTEMAHWLSILRQSSRGVVVLRIAKLPLLLELFKERHYRGGTLLRMLWVQMKLSDFRGMS